MKRGDVVTVVIQGAYGKPRPAVIIQSDQFIESHATCLVCLVTTFPSASPLFRLAIEPSAANGLRKPSEIMVDKIFPVEREKIGHCIGRLEKETIRRLNQAIALFCGLHH